MVGKGRRTDLAISAYFSGPFRPNSTFAAHTLLPSGTVTVAAACVPVRRTSGLRTIASAGRRAGRLVDRLGFPGRPGRGRRHGRPMSTKTGSIRRAALARPRRPAGIRSIPSRHTLCGAIARTRQGVGFPGVHPDRRRDTREDMESPPAPGVSVVTVSVVGGRIRRNRQDRPNVRPRVSNASWAPARTRNRSRARPSRYGRISADGRSLGPRGRLPQAAVPHRCAGRAGRPELSLRPVHPTGRHRRV